MDKNGELVATCKSQFDGFYLFERIRPGRYTVRVVPEQARRLGLTVEPRRLELGGGEVLNGVDFVAVTGG